MAFCLIYTNYFALNAKQNIFESLKMSVLILLCDSFIKMWKMLNLHFEARWHCDTGRLTEAAELLSFVSHRLLSVL